MPGPLSIGGLEGFLKERGDRYKVQWLDHTATKEAAPAGVEDRSVVRI